MEVLLGISLGKNKQWSPKIDIPTREETLHHLEPTRSDQGPLCGGPASFGELKLKKKPYPSSSVALDSGHPITSWGRTRRPILVLGILDCTTEPGDGGQSATRLLSTTVDEICSAVLHGLFNKMLLWPPFGAITDTADNSLYIYMYERSVSVDEVQNMLTLTVITKNREKLRG
ncbi:hypothetical protein VNO77_19466 [Canavalia gladiata]|uniref:Uncharacterized protein n=1 Tax=Canavalia gladiata TaxID=3824 RepID=A0AAN9LRD3_CANGL